MTSESESLFGSEEPQPVPAAASTPGLLDQIAGVFTAPRDLFERMRPNPRWIGAICLMAALGLALSLIWSYRADFELVMREMLERRGQTVPDSLEQVAAFQKKMSLFGSIVGVVIGVPLVTAASAGVLMLLGQRAAEGEPPTFRQAVAADVVPALVKLPQALLLLVTVTFRDFGGAMPDKLIPTALSFWVHPESPKMVSLLTWADPFALAYGVVYAFSLRYLLRFKWGAAIATVAVWCVLKLLLGLAFAR